MHENGIYEKTSKNIALKKNSILHFLFLSNYSYITYQNIKHRIVKKKHRKIKIIVYMNSNLYFKFKKLFYAGSVFTYSPAGRCISNITQKKKKTGSRQKHICDVSAYICDFVCVSVCTRSRILMG